MKALQAVMKSPFVAMLLAMSLMAGVATAADIKNEDPSKVVESVANTMLSDLAANREAYRKDPAKLNALIEKELLPAFDSAYSANLVLGKHRRTVTPEQKDRFVKAFYRAIVKSYGTALVEFTSDRLKVLPAQVDKKTGDATVKTTIKRSSGGTVDVLYSMRKTPEGWKAWDVIVEGISYVKSLRDDFGAEIEQKGIDAVIARLEKGEVEVNTDNPGAKSSS
jgi:phospholipid transport system substrate-binding protein